MCIFIDQKSSKGDENGKHGNRLVYGPAAYKKDQRTDQISSFIAYML